MEISESFKSVIKESEIPIDDQPPSCLSNINQQILKVENFFSEHSSCSVNIPISDRTLEFKNKFYPNVSNNEWNNWHWQIRNSIKSIKQLNTFFDLKESEKKIGDGNKDSLPLRITPYYASLIESIDNPTQAIRKSIVPDFNEFSVTKGEASDPLSENHDSPIANLVHRYPDRALFLSTGFCAAYCRYCTRSHMVAKEHKCHQGIKEWNNAFEYLKSHTEIRDVIISGGDPLTMSDDKIEYLLSNLRKIEHIEIIRIGTKVPVVLPQRITPELINIIKKYHPVFMSIHFTHYSEITPEVKFACSQLANAGIPLGSQTVLLKDINDNIESMKKLVHGLLKIRVRPYYLYQCDPILGSSHFRTPVSKGIEIIEGLRGHTSGYAIPHYVIDAPGGGGKIPVLPEYFKGKENDDVILRNYENKLFKYPDYIE